MMVTNFCNRNALLEKRLLVILHNMDDGKFSRYEIREILGKGGMAEVYRAYDPYFDREVALKILRREMVDDTRLKERFERETKIIAKLEIEAIVPVYDIGRGDKGQLFFVMRLMAGGTLSDRMQNGPISPEEVGRIVQRIAPALDDAHKRGIIHRDLKPGNILFDENNNAYISDFGIAKSVSFASTSTLTDGGVVGTPRYMSPEQARGDVVDARSDIYSLGVIVFEMLIGKTRFDVVTPLGLAFRDENSPVPRLQDTDPTFPLAVQDVIDKVLARDREKRYATSLAFADALTDALDEPHIVPHVPEPEQPVEPKPARSSARFWLAGGFIALVLILFALWGYPNLVASPPAPSPTREDATPTLTTTQPATATLTPQPPAITATSPVSVDPGIGGANKIALVANNEIYLMNIDGSNIESLTQTGVSKLDLQWLPNGNELLYIEGNCVYQVHVNTAERDIEQLLCFKDVEFQGFRVSPSGKLVAISMANRLMVLPFDVEALSAASSAFELTKLESLCLDYTDVAVKDALWSANGERLAIRYQSVVHGRIGDTIRVIEGNWDRCQDVAIIPWDEFPADRFVPNGYARYPILPSYQWDGDQRFVFNSFVRNRNYGDLYIYNMSTESVRQINPIDRNCCYGAAAFSPDGSHLLFVFQDVRQGSASRNRLYYVPVDQIGTGIAFVPLQLPRLFFENLDENVQLALRPAGP